MEAQLASIVDALKVGSSWCQMSQHCVGSTWQIGQVGHVHIEKLQEKMESLENPLRLKSLNHISLVCGSVEASIHFYQNVLGFIPIRRPGSFDFDGAWLFGHGIGVHLLQSEKPERTPEKKKINPKDNHISFQCESMGAVEKKLKEMELDYVQAVVEEGGILVEQLFFHDPDGFMIEICNCDNLPVVPLVGEVARSCLRVKSQIIPPPQPQIRRVVQLRR